jgi:hypothetical protein
MAFVRYKQVGKHTYISLEERYREGGKVKSRFLRSLGRVAGDMQTAKRMRRLSDEDYMYIKAELSAERAAQWQMKHMGELAEDRNERLAREKHQAVEKQLGVSIPMQPEQPKEVDKWAVPEAPTTAAPTTAPDTTSPTTPDFGSPSPDVGQEGNSEGNAAGSGEGDKGE